MLICDICVGRVLLFLGGKREANNCKVAMPYPSALSSQEREKR
jgi:hypothetical protein